MSTPKATAIVHVVVEVTLSQPWGPDCTVGQVYRQATGDALDAVRMVLEKAKAGAPMRIVEASSTQVRIAEEEQ